MEVNVAKFRNGAPFQERVKFWGDHQRIFDYGTEAQYYNPVPNSGGVQTSFDDGDFEY